MSDTTQGPESTAAPAARRWVKPAKIAALVLVSAIAGGAISRASDHWRGGPGWHHGPPPMGGFMEAPTLDPAEAERRVEFMVGHMAGSINATAEQKEKLTTIAKAAVKDLLPVRESLNTGRQKARELLGAATVDRAAIEALRSEHVADIEAMSKRVSAALADAAEVLTPEQRKEIAERFAKGGPLGGGWHERWRRWHHGSDRG